MDYKWEASDLVTEINRAVANRLQVVTGSQEVRYPRGTNHSGTVVQFSDSSVVYCSSSWSGPYSEVTPDIDPEPPDVWRGTPIIKQCDGPCSVCGK